MNALLSSARNALLAGIVLALAAIAVGIAVERVDALGFTSFVLRAIHVVAAIIWVGMIWFVNFVQHPAVVAADDHGRATLFRLVVPHVATIFRHTSHLVLLSGALLLLPTGYLLSPWVFGAQFHMSMTKALLLWGAAAGAVAMWVFVHMIIWPNLQIVLGEKAANAEAKAAARAKVALYARANLLLAIPVTVLMVAAAHLF
ncbi:hypothetical protein [Hyphomicrobium sp. CS1BSMeth3]|uniref:hypothetical protein n=1 Tax=Hyphomicrobium sp. CS1BSMeth3 TaxID=1892844 RepID=UPI0009302042|nr:hypothetical protein [Hyphomicrobium sp. CS1BSMeth3]